MTAIVITFDANAPLKQEKQSRTKPRRDRSERTPKSYDTSPEELARQKAF